MIEGRVNSNLEAIVAIAVIGPNGYRRTLQAAIDTGFNGYLTLPSEVISELGLRISVQYPVRLGDGSLQHVNAYDVLVELGDDVRRARVEPSEVRPLVGMALMRGYDLRVEIFEGGTVTLEPL